MFEDQAPSERRYKAITRPIGKLLGLDRPKMATPQIILPPPPGEEPRKELPPVDYSQVRRREDIVRRESSDRLRQRQGRRSTLFAGRGLGNIGQQVMTASKTLLGE